MTLHRQHRASTAPLRQVLLGLTFAVAGAGLAVAADVPSGHPVAVVELFTSQGCSSCPPANDNIARLATRKDVLALSFGVTYWDRLGWKDTFASPQFTGRQWAYARTLHHDNVFTPQVVVNGRADTVGQRLTEIDALIAGNSIAGGPALSLSSGTVRIGAGRAPAGHPADVWLVRYEPGVIEVPVRRGENTGRTLPHAHVVRNLVKLGTWDGHPAGIPLPAGPDGLAVAVLVQTSGTGPVIAAIAADHMSSDKMASSH